MGELPRRVVALGVGVHPAHHRRVGAIQPEEAEARARRCPTRNCRRGTSAGRRAPGLRPPRRRPPPPGARARSAAGPCRRRGARDARPAPGSPSRSRRSTGEARGAARPRWRTMTAAPLGARSTSHNARPKDQSSAPSGRRRPGTRMAWLATGSYQSKPTAASVRARGDACTADDHAARGLASGQAAQPGPGRPPTRLTALHRRATRRRRSDAGPPRRRGGEERRRRGRPGARPRSGRRRSASTPRWRSSSRSTSMRSSS